jgi:hypothetical protein
MFHHLAACHPSFIFRHPSSFHRSVVPFKPSSFHPSFMFRHLSSFHPRFVIRHPAAFHPSFLFRHQAGFHATVMFRHPVSFHPSFVRLHPSGFHLGFVFCSVIHPLFIQVLGFFSSKLRASSSMLFVIQGFCLFMLLLFHPSVLPLHPS